MQAYAVLLVALAAGANAAEEGGGFFDTIRNGISTAGAAISSIYTTPEMAPYTVIKTVVDADNETLYEERTYPAKKWVCTSEVVEDSEGLQRRDIFMRLFAYITGTNEEGQSIPMTAPVSMMRLPVEGESEESMSQEVVHSEEQEQETKSKFTMCFFINEEFQNSPPTPTNPDVFLEERPTITVIANRVGGYMYENDWEELAQKLKEDSMAKEETGVDYSRFYRAGYDSPMKLWNRRNEVWYVKQA